MITQETLASAQGWYETGVRRIENETYNLGISYLDKAIAVFAEVGDTRRLTHARHHKLLAYKLDGRNEEVESQYPAVMDGYVRLEDTYGQTLLLVHLAESLAHQDRLQRALAWFNLAALLAENDDRPGLLAYVLECQGRLYRHRENQVQAVRLFRRAEAVAEEHGFTYEAIRYRQQRAETLVELGELAEAYGLLEEVQSRLIHEERYREAVEPLSVLRRLYGNAGMEDDRDRVTRLMHALGQEMLRTDERRKPSVYEGPSIDSPQAG